MEISVFFAMTVINTAEAFGAWLVPHLLAALAPPAIYVIHRNRWQVSLRTSMALLTICALASFVLAARIRSIARSPVPGTLVSEYLANVASTAIPIFVVSIVLTSAVAYRNSRFGTGL
jgi:hypothetical protein